MENDALLHQISDYASAAVTPGTSGSFGNSLKVVENDFETQIEKKIKEGQAATQTKLESLFKGLQDADTAVDSAKTAAMSRDKTWLECAADEQAKRQAGEASDKGLTDSRKRTKPASSSRTTRASRSMPLARTSWTLITTTASLGVASSASSEQ